MKAPLALMLAALTSLAAAAAPLGPEEVRAFRIRSDQRSITVSAENRWLEAGGEVDRSGQYRQSLELDFTGSVYHPNLLTYSLASRLGVSEWESGGSAPPAYGLIADLHFLASLLREKPYPLGFHFDRRDDSLEYSLFEQTRVAETALGGTARWDNRWVPLLVSAEQSWKEEHQAGRTLLQDELVVRAQLQAESRDFPTRAEYTFADFDRRTLGLFAQQGRSHEARLTNNLAFGGSRQYGLSSSFRFLNLTGTLQQNLLDLTEQLRLRLPWELSGQASYSLRGAWDPLAESVAHQGRLQASHQLYESLTTTLGLDGSLTTASSFRQATLGPDLQLQYRKKIPAGLLFLDYRLETRYEDRQVSAQTAEILGESHVLDDLAVTLLELPGVVLSSVVVTDESGTLQYTEGDDYQLLRVGECLQVLRVPTGQIMNGETVRVSYSAVNNPSFQSFLLANAAGARVELFDQRLSVYYRYRGSRHPYATRAAVVDLTDDHLVGLGFRLPPVEASAEYERHGSPALSYDAVRGRQSLSQPLGGRSLLSLQGSESLVWFAEQGLLQGFLELIARYNLAAGRFLAMSAAGGWRLQTQTGTAPQSLCSARAGLSFRRGLLAASAEYDFLGPIPGGDHTLSVALTRRF